MDVINHSLYKKVSVLLVLLLSLTTINAQDKKLELEDLKKSALEYSNHIKNGNLRAEKAEVARQEAYSKYFPEVEATGLALYGFNDLIPPIPQTLPNGIDNIYSIGATATQAIYAGGKIRLANQLAQVQLESRKLGTEETMDSVVLATETKFWQLINIQEQQKVVRASKTYLNNLLKQQEDLLDAGLISKNQLLQVKVEKSGLLLRENELSNQRKIALLDLVLYAGISYDTTLVASKKSNIEIASPHLTYKNPELDIKNNTMYRLLEKQVEAAQLQVENEKANLLPQIGVGLNASKFDSFNNDLGIDIQPIAFGTITIPISAWWGGEKKQIRQSKIEVEIAENKLKDGKDQLTVGIMKSWYDLLNAYKQIQYSKDKLLYATENLETQRDYYDSGLTNLTDLLDAQQSKEEAEASVVNAFANYEQKEAVYLYRTHQLEIPTIKNN